MLYIYIKYSNKIEKNYKDFQENMMENFIQT